LIHRSDLILISYVGLCPTPRLVASGDPYAPRRFLAGAHVRAVL
jgi:hypothetical protein